MTEQRELDQLRAEIKRLRTLLGEMLNSDPSERVGAWQQDIKDAIGQEKLRSSAPQQPGTGGIEV